jgi:hypothetical protein
MRRKFNGAKQCTEDAGQFWIRPGLSVEERSARSEAKVETDVERAEVRMLA